MRNSKILASMLLVMTSISLVLAADTTTKKFLTDTIRLTGSGWITLAGLILTAASFWFINDSKQRKLWGNIGIGAAVIGFILVLVGGALFDENNWVNKNPFGKTIVKEFGGRNVTILLSSVAGGQVAGGQVAGGGICPYDGVTVTLSAKDKYTAASAGGTHRYKINGNPALTVADGGTFSATPGDSVEVLFANGSSGSNYFGERKTTKLPCSATTTISTDLVQNGTLTIEVFNEELNLISAPENETLGAGDVVTLTANLKGTYQRGYAHGGVIVVEFNNSDYDDIIADFGGSTTTIPNFFTVSNTANVARAYTVPPILSNQILAGKITLDVDATNNPGDVNDPVIRFYPNNYFLNEDTGGSFDGPAVGDEDNAQVLPIHTTSFTLSVD